MGVRDRVLLAGGREAVEEGEGVAVWPETMGRGCCSFCWEMNTAERVSTRICRAIVILHTHTRCDHGRLLHLSVPQFSAL